MRTWDELTLAEQIELKSHLQWRRCFPQSVLDIVLVPILEAYITSESALISPDPYANKRETIQIPYKPGAQDRGITRGRR